MPAVVLTTLCWGIVVFAARFVAVHNPGLGPTGPWIAAMFYGGLLSTFICLRFARGRWRHAPLAAA